MVPARHLLSSPHLPPASALAKITLKSLKSSQDHLTAIPGSSQASESAIKTFKLTFAACGLCAHTYIHLVATTLSPTLSFHGRADLTVENCKRFGILTCLPVVSSEKLAHIDHVQADSLCAELEGRTGATDSENEPEEAPAGQPNDTKELSHLCVVEEFQFSRLGTAHDICEPNSPWDMMAAIRCRFPFWQPPVDSQDIRLTAERMGRPFMRWTWAYSEESGVTRRWGVEARHHHRQKNDATLSAGPSYMCESPHALSASTNKVSQVMRLARWVWTVPSTTGGMCLWRWCASAALDGWSWAGHCMHHVVWGVEGIGHATSGGSGGGVKRKELMDSSMTMERRAGSDWNKYGTRAANSLIGNT
ncbi:hypothetical protein C8J57DRAFT_1226033 [Mycena rebaudengoi]|nr:hypothetical protein C8J57DRAFT_1226033 [Mycena rebaudengoi]